MGREERKNMFLVFSFRQALTLTHLMQPAVQPAAPCTYGGHWQGEALRPWVSASVLGRISIQKLG